MCVIFTVGHKLTRWPLRIHIPQASHRCDGHLYRCTYGNHGPLTRYLMDSHTGASTRRSGDLLSWKMKSGIDGAFRGSKSARHDRAESYREYGAGEQRYSANRASEAATVSVSESARMRLTISTPAQLSCRNYVRFMEFRIGHIFVLFFRQSRITYRRSGRSNVLRTSLNSQRLVPISTRVVKWEFVVVIYQWLWLQIVQRNVPSYINPSS